MVGKTEVEVVAGDRLTVAFGGKRRALAELVESIARGDIERPVEVHQGAVEVEEDRLEATFQMSNHSGRLGRGVGTAMRPAGSINTARCDTSSPPALSKAGRV